MMIYAGGKAQSNGFGERVVRLFEVVQRSLERQSEFAFCGTSFSGSFSLSGRRVRRNSNGGSCFGRSIPVGGAGGGGQGAAEQAGDAAYVAPQLCDASAGGWNGHSERTGF